MEIEYDEAVPTRGLLIPGNDLSAAFYRPFTHELAARGLGVAICTPSGFGLSAPLTTPSFEQLVDEIASIAPGPEVLIGHSLGGLLALLVAARRPNALTHLVLLEPTVFPSRRIAHWAARRYAKQVVHGDRTRFVNHNGLSRRASRPNDYPKEMIELYLETRRLGDPTTAEALMRELPALYPLPYEDVQAPTLVVQGSEVGRLARLMRRDLMRRLRPARATLAGAAHWLVNEDDAALADMVSSFLA